MPKETIENLTFEKRNIKILELVEMSGTRSNFQFLNNPLAIRQEIQRFESVHPSIYAIYDLIELVPDQQIAQQIRDHVVCIEGWFVY